MHTLLAILMPLIAMPQGNALGVELGSVSAKGTIRYKAKLRPNLYRVTNTAIIERRDMGSAYAGSMGKSGTGASELLQANIEVETKLFEQPDGKHITTGTMSFETRDRKFRFNGRVILAAMPNDDTATVVSRGFISGELVMMMVRVQAPEKGAAVKRRNLVVLLITPSEVKDEAADAGKNGLPPFLWKPLLDTTECYFFSGGAFIRRN